MTGVVSPLWRKFRVYQVFGANTNVGKTIFSTILCRAARRQTHEDGVWYLKPVSTGPSNDSDKWHLDLFTRNVSTQSIYQFNAPISPHLAAETPVSDETLLKKIAVRINSNAECGSGFMLIETAGGPNSPGPSGTLQSDLYRPLRLPVVYIADWRLGGISSSISGYESLKIRGYDVEGVAVFQDLYYKNYQYFQSYFGDQGISVLAIPQPPEQTSDHDHTAMNEYYLSLDKASNASNESSDVDRFTEILQQQHDARISRLQNMADEAHRKIWYPFTQHQSLSPGSITTIDSAQGDYFQVFKAETLNSHTKTDTALLKPTVDGSASWWTQGLGHANPTLTLSAAYTAGRYGHVMFASAIHEPALNLADTLLETINNPRLSRVFYSDNGSTGMEVAVKMALKASCVRYGWDHTEQEVEIIGLKNSYHGDTIGSMDMSEPSIYNARVQWYKSRGFWFDVPTVKMCKGQWIVEKPPEVSGALGANTYFKSLQDIFDRIHETSEIEDATMYKTYINTTLQRLTQLEKRRFGALVIEPVVLGAGGMQLVDPLFQRILINTIRESANFIALDESSLNFNPSPDNFTKWSGLPVVADEVFTGLFRLGHASPCIDLLKVEPDISTHAKLLTGGLLPLAATCASESIFEAFLSEGKEDALLHGHSYTAHAVGCAVGATSLRLLMESKDRGGWQEFIDDWDASKAATPGVSAVSKSEQAKKIWSVWSQSFVDALSKDTGKVESVWALGSVLAIELCDEGGRGGYASNAAKGLQHELLHGGSSGTQDCAIHSRVLGNVLYLMSSQMTKIEDVRAWQGRVRAALDA